MNIKIIQHHGLVNMKIDNPRRRPIKDKMRVFVDDKGYAQARFVGRKGLFPVGRIESILGNGICTVAV